MKDLKDKSVYYNDCVLQLIHTKVDLPIRLKDGQQALPYFEKAKEEREHLTFALRWHKGIFIFTDLPRKSPIYIQPGRDK